MFDAMLMLCMAYVSPLIVTFTEISTFNSEEQPLLKCCIIELFTYEPYLYDISGGPG